MVRALFDSIGILVLATIVAVTSEIYHARITGVLVLGFPALLFWIASSKHQRRRAQFEFLTWSLGGCAVMVAMAGGGAFCIFTLIAIGLLIVLFIYFLAWMMGMYIPGSHKRRRPTRLSCFVLVGVLGMAHGLELHFRGPAPVESHTTTRRIDASTAHVWDALRFYEEVDHEPPLLLKLFPRPVRTLGPLDQHGPQVCEYTSGYVVKELVACEREREITFEVLEQELGFDRSFHLVSGCYELAPASSSETLLSATTTYEARLGPRWFWRPIEDWIGTTFHEYLIEGVDLEIERTEMEESSHASNR